MQSRPASTHQNHLLSHRIGTVCRRLAPTHDTRNNQRCCCNAWRHTSVAPASHRQHDTCRPYTRDRWRGTVAPRLDNHSPLRRSCTRLVFPALATRRCRRWASQICRHIHTRRWCSVRSDRRMWWCTQGSSARFWTYTRRWMWNQTAWMWRPEQYKSNYVIYVWVKKQKIFVWRKN